MNSCGQMQAASNSGERLCSEKATATPPTFKQHVGAISNGWHHTRVDGSKEAQYLADVAADIWLLRRQVGACEQRQQPLQQLWKHAAAVCIAEKAGAAGEDDGQQLEHGVHILSALTCKPTQERELLAKRYLDGSTSAIKKLSNG
jgi:hypothetical protein